MLTDLYQEYLFIIGKLKDIYGLHIDVDHKDIHTFFKDKKPVFKLFFGVFDKQNTPTIVVSFHLDLIHAEAIQWFLNIYNIHPLVKIHDSYIEDSNGECYLGEDAMALREVYLSQDVLSEWLENHSVEEIQDFVDSDIMGRDKDPTKTFDSLHEKSEAIIEFERMRKPTDDSEVH